MKVLLPIVGKDDMRLIAGFVANFTWPPSTEYKIIHILPMAVTDEQYEQNFASAKNMLKDAVAQLSELIPGPQISTDVRSGSAAGEIMTYARQWQCNMIIVGHRTGKSIKEALAGSVSSAVAAEAPCSVVVIRPPEVLSEKKEAASEREKT
jgi:nucleotide-binding universal stress UspA family protein